jgi:molybdopterin-guanine dinucleotide biosynthesis protein A
MFGFARVAVKVSLMELVGQRHIIGVILAGGLSRRMGGGDKGLVSLGRTTMLGEIVRRVGPQVRRLILNANGDPARFAELGLAVVGDATDDYPGPLAGLLTGMRWAAANVSGATHVLSVSCDAPFLPADLTSRLAAALPADGRGIAMAGSNGEAHPVIGLWSIDLVDDLAAALGAGVRKVRAWADRHGAVTVDFPLLTAGQETIDPFFNANTPAELDEARRLLDLVSV